MLGNKIIYAFNNLTQMMLSDILQSETTTLKEVKLVSNSWVRPDLVFRLTGDYNNRKILYESILETCDDLFAWIDIHQYVRIVIIAGKVSYFSYFELFDEVYKDDYYNYTRKERHPKYQKYREWKKNELAEESVRKEYEKYMNEIQRRHEEQVTKIEPKKKKFLFW